MKKQPVIIIMIVLLLLVNLVTMAFFWSAPQRERGGAERTTAPERRRAQVVEFLNQELGLTAAQEQAFQQLRADFFEKSRDIRSHIRAERKDFYEHIISNNEEAARQRAALIARQQKELEMTTFYHFQDLRSQLDEEQQEKFDEVMAEMLNARWMERPRRGRGMRQGRDR